MSWMLNMEASMGFQPQNSNSLYLQPLSQYSLSSRLFLPPSPTPQPHFHPHENTISFAALDQIHAHHQSPSSHEESSWVEQRGSKRGLKFLAYELMRTIRKHRPISQGDIGDLVQQITRHSHQSERSREEKNIRRRIYDALNVMIAAGMLERGAQITLRSTCGTNAVETQHMVCRQQLQRIRTKRELRQGLNSKLTALNFWLARNRRMPRAPNLKTDSLTFPLIILLHEGTEKYLCDERGELLAIRSCKPVLLSETDMIQGFYQNEQLSENAPSEKDVKVLDV